MVHQSYQDKLIEQVEVAKTYINILEQKRFKSLRDRRALHYWIGYSEGLERSLYLAKTQRKYFWEKEEETKR